MVPKKVVILAGGLGTRLRPYTFFVPKPMLPLGDKPVLEHLMEWLKEQGFKDLILCVGYLRHVIEEYFGDGSSLGLTIKYVRSSRPLGTAGQLKTAQSELKETFLCIYGDTLLDLNLTQLLSFHETKGCLATMALLPYTAQLRYGFIELEEDGRVKDWREKPEVKGLINVGCYVMEPRFLDYIPEGEAFSMDQAFSKALEAGERIYGMRVEGSFIDIGDRRSYLSAHERYLQRLGRLL